MASTVVMCARTASHSVWYGASLMRGHTLKADEQGSDGAGHLGPPRPRPIRRRLRPHAVAAARVRASPCRCHTLSETRKAAKPRRTLPPVSRSRAHSKCGSRSLGGATHHRLPGWDTNAIRRPSGVQERWWPAPQRRCDPAATSQGTQRQRQPELLSLAMHVAWPS